MTRLDSKLEAIGAEYMVLANLLIEKIEAHKAYLNAPGFDLIATNPVKNSAARIQVKSRWATDFDGGFLVKNTDCDFIVFVALNRGNRYGRRPKADGSDRLPPKCYVFPVTSILAAKERGPRSKWGKVFLKHIDNPASFVERWDLIRAFLDRPIIQADK